MNNANSPQKVSPSQTFLQGVVSLLLFLLASTMGFVGWRTLSSGVYEYTWHRNGGFALGPVVLVADASKGVARLEGTLAKVAGFGFCSCGALFLLWTIMVVRKTYRKPLSGEEWTVIDTRLVWLSLLLLTTTTLAMATSNGVPSFPASLALALLLALVFGVHIIYLHPRLRKLELKR